MNCPECENRLTPVTVEAMTVDACEAGCGGLWFDRFELQKVDEPHESAGERLLQFDRKEGTQPDGSKRFNCPKCGVVMMRHFWSVKKHVLVDQCPQCAGYWLDAGELALIRKLFPTEEARKKAAEAYFEEIFGKQLAEMKAKGEEAGQRASKIAQMFRFICPSYYLPGKQQWGAF